MEVSHWNPLSQRRGCHHEWDVHKKCHHECLLPYIFWAGKKTQELNPLLAVTIATRKGPFVVCPEGKVLKLSPLDVPSHKLVVVCKNVKYVTCPKVHPLHIKNR